MSCELLVPEIFNAAKLYFDILLADGLPLSRVKELRLRPYVVRFQRMINGKRKSLYKWKPEFVETIRTTIQRPDPPKIEEVFHELEIPTGTESQQKVNTKVSTEVSIAPPIDSSFLEGSSSLFSTSYNERAEESETFNAICYGECSFPDFKRRIMLINGYYKRLTSTGMTIDELRRFDLYGMLINTLKAIKPSKPGILVLKPTPALFISKLIEKHCSRKNNLKDEFKFALTIARTIGNQWQKELIERRNRFFTIAFKPLAQQLEDIYKQWIEESSKIQDETIRKQMNSYIEEFNSKTELGIKEMHVYFNIIQSEKKINTIVEYAEEFIINVQSLGLLERLSTFNVKEAWCKSIQDLKQKEILPSDKVLIVNYLKKSNQMINDYEIKEKVQLTMNMIDFTKIFMVISKYIKMNTFSSLTFTVLQDEMKTIDKADVETITTMYLESLSD